MIYIYIFRYQYIYIYLGYRRIYVYYLIVYYVYLYIYIYVSYYYVHIIYIYIICELRFPLKMWCRKIPGCLCASGDSEWPDVWRLLLPCWTWEHDKTSYKSYIIPRFGVACQFSEVYSFKMIRWWFQICCIFTPIPGEMIQFDEHIFQMGASTTN